MTLMNSLAHLIVGSVLVLAGTFAAWEAIHSARNLFVKQDERYALFGLWVVAGGLMAYGGWLVIQGFMR